MKKDYSPDGSLRICLTLEPDGNYFNFVIDYIIEVLKAILINKLSTPIMDQVYFDFQYEQYQFTLFFEDTAGIYLIALNEEANKFLEELDLSEVEYSKYLKSV